MDPGQKAETTMTSTITALPIAFIDACIECNRRGLKEFEATGHPGYSFRASDRAALECLRWIEAAFPDASEEHIAHSAYCFAQGARGTQLSRSACADVAFGVGDQRVTDVTIYGSDTAGMALPVEWHDGSNRYQPADWRGAAERRELWLVRREPEQPELVISATQPKGSTERVVRVIGA